MTETLQTQDTPPVPPVAPGSPPTAGLPASPQSPSAATKPEFLPDDYWDAKAGAIKVEDFGKHYVELATAHKTHAERMAAVPKTADDYKADLPADFKPPEGVKINFDDKDPVRGPILAEARALAREIGVDQPTFSKMLALQAKLEVAQHDAFIAAETARVAEETKKLGDNAPARIDAVTNWNKALLDGGKITKPQFEAFRRVADNADGVEYVEAIIKLVNGNVPGTQPSPPPRPETKSHAERIWPGGFAAQPQARAS